MFVEKERGGECETWKSWEEVKTSCAIARVMME